MNQPLRTLEAMPLQAPHGSGAHAVVNAAAALGGIRDRIQIIQRAMKESMQEDVHYGKIPGTEKATLLKPGAEMLCALFQFSPEVVPTQVADYPDVVRPWKGRRKKWFDGPRGRDFSWEEIQGETSGYYEVISTCTIRAANGAVIATAAGSCNNLENKYREQIVWDVRNTILKMSGKRALIASVLLATGCSDMFTQDLDDDWDGEHDAPPKAAKPSAGPRPAASAPAAQPSGGAGGDDWGPFLSEKQRGAAFSKVSKLKLDHDAGHRVLLAVSRGPRGAAVEFMNVLFSQDDAKIRAAFEGHPAWKASAPEPAKADASATPPPSTPPPPAGAAVQPGLEDTGWPPER
jgi:hypothetical protein